MNMLFHVKQLSLAGAIAWMAATAAQAQIGNSVAVGNSAPATDVLGRNLPGTWGFSNEACRIEIREVGLGIVRPPATEAEIEAANPLLRTTYLGYNVLGPNPGKFSEQFTDRGVLAGKSYYARVYDAPSTAAAMYFSDSFPFQDAPPAEWGVVPTIHVVFQPVQLVSGEEDLDTDGDGIPDALELEEFGTDPTAKDTDEDGYDDGFEVAYDDYLDPGEPDVNELRVTGQEGGGDYWAAWWAIPGVTYRLEFRPAWIDGTVFTQVWSGAASGTNLEISVQNWMQTNSPKGFFRYTVP